MTLLFCLVCLLKHPCLKFSTFPQGLDGQDQQECESTAELGTASDLEAKLDKLKARQARKQAQIKQLEHSGESQLSRTDSDARTLRKAGQKHKAVVAEGRLSGARFHSIGAVDLYLCPGGQVLGPQGKASAKRGVLRTRHTRPAKAARSRGSACANLAEARTQLVAMIGESDPAKLDDYNAKVQAASSALDADLASMAGGPDAAKADAFKPVWEAFKETREADIIPAVYGGEPEKAKAVATGVQAGRMKEMKAAMGCE